MKYKQTLIWILIAGVSFFLVFKIVRGFMSNAEAFSEALPSKYDLSPQDSNLISLKYKDRFVVNEVLQSKVRNPISLITIDNLYSLIIYSIEFKNINSLNKMLHVEKENMDRSVGTTYNIVDNNRFRFQYKAGETHPISQIFLTLSGDSIMHIINNDSLISYYMLCRNISVRYAHKDPIDIYFESDIKGLNVPINILFLQRNKILYLLILAPNETNGTIPSNLIYDIISK